MPLKKGKSNIGANIHELDKKLPFHVARAIALRVAYGPQKKKKSSSTKPPSAMAKKHKKNKK